MSEKGHSCWVRSVIVGRRFYRAPSVGDLVAGVGDIPDLPCEGARRLGANARKTLYRQTERRVRGSKGGQEPRGIGVDQSRNDLGALKASIGRCLPLRKQQ